MEISTTNVATSSKICNIFQCFFYCSYDIIFLFLNKEYAPIGQNSILTFQVTFLSFWILLKQMAGRILKRGLWHFDCFINLTAVLIRRIVVTGQVSNLIWKIGEDQRPHLSILKNTLGSILNIQHITQKQIKCIENVYFLNVQTSIKQIPINDATLNCFEYILSRPI